MTELGVLGAVDLPHAAAADERDDFVAAEASAGSEGQTWVVELVDPTGNRTATRADRQWDPRSNRACGFPAHGFPVRARTAALRHHPDTESCRPGDIIREPRRRAAATCRPDRRGCAPPHA